MAIELVCVGLLARSTIIPRPGARLNVRHPRCTESFLSVLNLLGLFGFAHPPIAKLVPVRNRRGVVGRAEHKCRRPAK